MLTHIFNSCPLCNAATKPSKTKEFPNKKGVRCSEHDHFQYTFVDNRNNLVLCINDFRFECSNNNVVVSSGSKISDLMFEEEVLAREYFDAKTVKELIEFCKNYETRYFIFK